MATTIVSRATKGTPLTVAEHDANHQNAANTADSALITATDAQAVASLAQTTAIAAQGTAGAAQTSADGKAPGGTLIVYTSTGRSLVAGDNGNIIRCTNAGTVGMHIPAGLPTGFGCVLVQGGAGQVTVSAGSGVTLTAAPGLLTTGIESDLLIDPAGTNTYTVHSPVAAGSGGGATTLAELTDIVTFNMTANTSVANIKQTADAAYATVPAPVVRISGVRGTGNTLSVIGASWNGTSQWQSKISGTWTDIAGATAPTYVQQAADATRDIRVLFTTTSFISNELAAPAGASFTTFTETWLTQGATGSPIANGWTNFLGNPLTFVNAGMGWLDPNPGPYLAYRNAGGSNGVIEISRAANSGNGGANYTPAEEYIYFRGSGTGYVGSYLQFAYGSDCLRYYEWDGVGPTNVVNGPATIVSGGVSRGVKITLNNANVVVEVDFGSGYTPYLTATAVQGLTSSFVGVGQNSAGILEASVGPVSIYP